MSDTPQPNPPGAPTSTPAPSPAPPAQAAQGAEPLFKNRGGVALVVGLAIVGLGIYVLQPNNPPGPPPAAPRMLANLPNTGPGMIGSRAKMRLTPEQVEAIRAAKEAHRAHPEIGPDGKVTFVPNTRQPLPPAARAPVAAAVATALTSAPPPEKGAIDKDEVHEAINTLLPAMHSCYEQGLKQSAGLAGQVTVEFTLHKDAQGGSFAKEGQVADSTLKSPLVEACMLENINRAHFPQIKGEGEVKVRYPFKLSPEAK